MSSGTPETHSGTQPDPEALAPDDKDWTWVLDRPCAECGFEAGSFDAESVGPAIRGNVEAWIQVLANDGVAIRRRPDATTWSALEYACHVRDVLRIFDERLGLMLTEDGPQYPNWDQDVTALEQRYDLQDPLVVSDELALAGQALADHFDGVSGEQWARTGRRSDGAEFTIATLAQYFMHDPIHHLHDIQTE